MCLFSPRCKFIPMTGHFGNTFLSLNVGLQMADAVLDARVTALEESGGANEQNGNLKKKAFLTCLFGFNS